ncbi:MAG TPA: hypothetical protein VGH89_05430 [Pseudonocardia sp.]|jgi:hypothetical protein
MGETEELFAYGAGLLVINLHWLDQVFYLALIAIMLGCVLRRTDVAATEVKRRLVS